MKSPIKLEILEYWMDTHGLGSGAIYDQQPLSGGTQNIMFRFGLVARAVKNEGFIDFSLQPPLQL